MSAFIVSQQHIDAICTAAITYPDYGVAWQAADTSWRKLNKGDPLDAIGHMLWEENVASVSYRYDDCEDGDWPGPIGLTIDQVRAYRHQPPKRLPTVVEALKLLNCYEYQSCEHDGWETSEASAFIKGLRRALIYALPGYDQAPWEWHDTVGTGG